MTTNVVNTNHLLVPQEWQDKWLSMIDRSKPQFKPKALKIHNDIQRVLTNLTVVVERAKQGEYKSKSIKCKARYRGERPLTVGDDMYSLLNGTPQTRLQFTMQLVDCTSLICQAEEIHGVLFPNDWHECGAKAISLGIVTGYLHGWANMQPSRAIATWVNSCMNDISYVERDPEGMTRAVSLHMPTDQLINNDEWFEMCEGMADITDHQARQNDEDFVNLREMLSLKA